MCGNRIDADFLKRRNIDVPVIFKTGNHMLIAGLVIPFFVVVVSSSKMQSLG